MLVLRYYLCILLLLGLSSAQAQNNAAEYDVKAAFLYKFCFYIEWPDTVFEQADSPIVIGVSAPDAVVDALKAAVEDRSVNGRSFEVIEVNEEQELAKLHIWFVARNQQASHQDLINEVAEKPVLVVTEIQDGLDRGSSVNFSIEDQRVRFDVSLDTIKRQGLKLSAQLLKVARVVRGGAES